MKTDHTGERAEAIPELAPAVELATLTSILAVRERLQSSRGVGKLSSGERGGASCALMGGCGPGEAVGKIN